jgi:molecular chaperone GrpE
MSTEDEDKISKPDTEGQEAQAPTNGASEPSAELEAPKKEEEKGGSRMNAAKAFYRAMYAGEDAAPEDFGMDMGRAAGQGQSSAADTQRIRDLEQQVTELEAKNTETDTHLKRMAADFENYRRRTEKEREEFASNGALRAIEAILPALDDLDRAQQTLNPNMDAKAILDAFKLCANSFTRCLEQIGAKPLTVIGEPFDPRLHEPVQEIRTNEYPDSTVIHELRRGFMFKERVLRPALVNVTASLSEEEAAEQEAAKAEAAAAAPPAPAATPDWVEEVAAAEAAPTQVAETAEPVPAAAEAEAAPEAPAAAPTADQALQKLVKTDDRRSGTETIDINLPPINVLPDMELTAPQSADVDGDETVQVYEISEEDASAPTEDLAEAQPAKVSDD